MTNLKTEYLKNPIGIDVQAPRLSWQMDTSRRGAAQTAYRVMVASSLDKLQNGTYDMWDFSQNTDKSTGIVYAGQPLQPRTRYHWQVAVTDEQGATVTSVPACFETGLMDEGWSQAQWITAPDPDTKGFEDTTFTLETDVKIGAVAAGINFGAKTSANRHMWQFLSSGEDLILRPHVWTDGTIATPEPGGQSGVNITAKIGITFAQAKQSFFRVKIAVVDGVTDTYVNGTLVCTHRFDRYKLGYFGFRQSGSEIGVFDNVVVKDANGTVLFSEDFSDTTHGFEGGILTDGALTVKSNDYCVNKTDEPAPENPDNRPLNGATRAVNTPAPMLRREFTAAGKVVKARLYATAAGNAEWYINGNRVGDAYFDPGRTNYSHTLQYQTYDITDLVKSCASNAIGAYVGHGWFQTKWNNFGAYFGVLLKLVLTYDDGTETTVVSDNAFKSYSDGPIRYEDIMNGETYDANYEVDGWSEAGLDDSAWQPVVCRTATMMKVAEIPVYTPTTPITAGVKLTPVSVKNIAANTFVYDFGQNIAGIPSMKLFGQKGDKIRVTYGEWLNENMPTGANDGSVYRGNLTDAQATDYYVCKGDPNGEAFHPSMTYHGFRYMQVEALNFALDDIHTFATQVRGCVLYNAMERTGSFTCSHAGVNRLYENSYWSNIDNFLGIPTDCPQRGERAGWTGDIQVYGRTATYNLDAFAFLEKYAADLRRDRNPATGNYPEVAPAPTWRGETTSAGWGDVAILLPWTLYLAYGDTRILEENYTGMTGWINHLVTNSDHYLRPNQSQYGDWLEAGATWNNETNTWNCSTPANVTNNAYAAYSSAVMAKIAAILGKPDDAKTFAAHAEGFRRVWVEQFTDGSGKTHCDSQTSYAMGLMFRLFDEKDRANAAANLVRLLEERGYRLKVGFLGVNLLVPALTDAGHVDVAYKLLEQEQFPSWLYGVNLGATTTFESWSGLRQNEAGQVSVHQSLNHYSYGVIAEWLYRYVLGIDTAEDATGYKHILLHPTPGGSLTYASGSYDSIHGTIQSGWKIDGATTTYTFTIPANTTATVTLPLQDGTVTENGTPLERAEDVSNIVYTTDTVSFDILSGTYTFATSRSA